VLGAELRAGIAGRDWVVSAPGVVELRALRGWAAVCPTLGSVTEVVVAYRGLRAPDPSKDSLLALASSPPWAPVGLVSRRAEKDGCPSAPDRLPVPGATLERWVLDRPVANPVLLRLYERGSYHLTDGTLRYRRGLGGRQPLTPAIFDPERTSIIASDSVSKARLTVYGLNGIGRPWIRTLFGNDG